MLLFVLYEVCWGRTKAAAKLQEKEELRLKIEKEMRQAGHVSG